MPRPGYLLFSLVILLVILSVGIAADLAIVGGAETRQVEINTRLNVIVVAFDPSHRMLGSLAGHSWLEEFNVSTYWFQVMLVANITYLYAPAWAVDELRQWLASHYVDNPVPGWAEGYASLYALKVRWVELRPFYEHLWRLSKKIVLRLGMHVDDIVAVIGNIDNVSRQYYEEPASYINVEPIEGVRGWAGEHPLVFYDLTVIPKPWPEDYVPFHDRGIAVNISTEPPLWSLSDPARYIQRLVEDHIRHHLLGFADSIPWYSSVLRVHVYVVDLGNESLTRLLINEINTSLVKKLISLMNPFTEIKVSIGKLDKRMPAYAVLERLVEGSERVNGWISISLDNLTATANWLSKEKPAPLNGTPCIEERDDRLITIHSACDYYFLILATPRPSYIQGTIEGAAVEFSAISFPPHPNWLGIGIASYPGYRERIMKPGIEMVIAHEVGHYMGFIHPFQTSSNKLNNIRWIMDFIETPMSYYNPVLAYYRCGDKSPYNSYEAALIHRAAEILEKNWTRAYKNPEPAPAIHKPGLEQHTIYTTIIPITLSIILIAYMASRRKGNPPRVSNG